MGSINFSFQATSSELNVAVAPGSQSYTLANNDTFSVTRTLAANDADGEVELWANTMAMATFEQAIIEVDPGQALSVSDKTKQIIVELTTASGTVFAFGITRACPLVLTSDDAGANSGAVSSTISRIAVRNLNTTPAIDVRLVLTK